jgi:hypothetical protein
MNVLEEISVPDALMHQAVLIMEATHRLAVSTAPFLRSEHVFDSWPFPVALTRHKWCKPAILCFGSCCSLTTMTAWYAMSTWQKETAAGRQPSLKDSPSMGWWLDQLGSSLEGESDFRAVVKIAQAEKVVHLRNERRGHGWMSPDTESYREDAERLEAVISRIESELKPFLESYDLIIPREIKVASNQYVFEGEHLVGCHVLHPPFKKTLSADPRSLGISDTGKVHLARSSMNQFWNISRYIRSALCPECQHQRILISDGRTQFIDVLMGHRVELGDEPT